MRVLAGFGAPKRSLFVVVPLVFSKILDAIFPVPLPPPLHPCAVFLRSTIGDDKSFGDNSVTMVWRRQSCHNGTTTTTTTTTTATTIERGGTSKVWSDPPLSLLLHCNTLLSKSNCSTIVTYYDVTNIDRWHVGGQKNQNFVFTENFWVAQGGWINGACVCTLCKWSMENNSIILCSIE